MQSFDREFADYVYLYAIAAFTVGLGFACLGFATSKSAEKRGLALVLLLVDFCATSTYLLHFFRLSPAINDKNGYPVDVGRYLEWLTCCPSLIALIGNITRSKDIIDRTVFNDYLLVITGFFASILREPFSEIALIFSCGAHCIVVIGLYDMFTNAIEGRTDCKLDKSALKLARFATILAWNAFPLVYAGVRFQFISFAQGEAGYVCADVIAKVFLTLILINASVEDSQNQKVGVLTDIAKDMEAEMGNTEKLLERMMPAEVIQQIKNGEATSAQEYDNVTVFFSDIANFTVLSGKTSTKDMLNTLNNLWIEYDAIAKKWGIYKVETIGDAYLAVAGCPERVPDHAARAANFSLDIIDMITNFKTAMGDPIQIRVGLNSGPITAGILGEMNPHWCIVGDTVNTASRMESSSKAMCIHISESTYNQIKNKNFILSDPDVMNIKVI